MILRRRLPWILGLASAGCVVLLLTRGRIDAPPRAEARGTAPPSPATPPQAAKPLESPSVVDIRERATRIRASARREVDALRHLVRILHDPSQPRRERELAACVLGSLPGPEALAALSQALSGSTDDDWTRLLLLAIGSSKGWDDDDAFSLDGGPYAVALPIGLTLTIQFTIADDVVRAQVAGFLAAPFSYPVREAAAFALRHSLEHGDARTAFLEAARGRLDAEFQGLLGGPLARWAAGRPPEDVEGRKILGTLLELGSAPDADPLRFNAESGLKQARLGAGEVASVLALLEGDHFDRRRWALSILGVQARRQDLPERTAVQHRIAALLANDPEPKIREHAAAGLSAYVGEEAARAALGEALRDAAWHVRARAAETLGRWPSADARVTEALLRASQDENESVRKTCESSLRALSSRSR